MLKQFGHKHQIPIASRSIDADELKAELIQRANTDSLPDAVIVPADFLGLPNLKFSPVLSDFTNKIDNEQVKQTASINGSVLGLPIMTGNHLLLYVNRALIKKTATDWEALESQQQRLPANTELIGWSFNEMYWFIPFLTAFDGDTLQNGKVSLDTVAMQQALNFYWGLSQKGVVEHQCDYRCATDKFKQGKLAYLISGFWAYDELENELADNLQVAALPSINGHAMRSYFTSYVLAFPGNSLYGRKRESLQKLAAYFIDSQQQQRLWQELKALPAEKSALYGLMQQHDLNLQVAITQLNQSVPLPSQFSMAVVWESMSIGFRRYGAGIVTAEQASRLMQHLAEKSANASLTRVE
nr:extracellular solute-binding protein [Neptunicella marina]